MHKPKMLVFSHLCSPALMTGTEKILMFMLGEFNSSFSCTLVVPNEGVMAEKAREGGIPVTVLKVPLIEALYAASANVRDEVERGRRSAAWPELVKLLLRFRPEIVLVHSCINPLPAIAAKALGIPLIWTIMERICETPHTSLTLELIEQHTDWVICISRTAAAPLRTAGLTKKTTILPPSWRMEELRRAAWPASRQNRRKQLGFQEQHKVIGYISSSIDAGKGLDHYMKMAVRVAAMHPGAMFLVCGNPVDASYFDSCMDIGRQAGVMERFRWIKIGNNIQEIYPAMDVLVIPRLITSGFVISALEGLAFGKTLVVYGSDGLAEILKATGNEDYIVPAGDVEGLAERVSSLLADEGRLRAVGARNSLAAERVFGIDAYEKRLGEFLRSVKLRINPQLKLVRGSGLTVYLYTQGILRPFTSEHAFLQGGNRFEEVRSLPDDMLNAIPVGEPIRAAGKRRRSKRSSRRKKRSTVRKMRRIRRK